MATRLTFPVGLDAVMVGWTADVFKWALLTSAATPDPSSQTFLSALTADELTDASYSRVTVTGAVRSTIAPFAAALPGYVTFDCDDPSFGVISGAEVAAFIVLYAEVTTDADSPIVATIPTYYLADGVASADFVVNPTYGAVAVSTFCPGEF